MRGGGANYARAPSSTVRRRAPAAAPPSRRTRCHDAALTRYVRRRPSYHDPKRDGTSGEIEIGVAYSQEEEMTGRLHDQMVENSKKSKANLAQAA